jgi:hypothetical protein
MNVCGSVKERIAVIFTMKRREIGKEKYRPAPSLKTFLVIGYVHSAGQANRCLTRSRNVNLQINSAGMSLIRRNNYDNSWRDIQMQYMRE